MSLLLHTEATPREFDLRSAAYIQSCIAIRTSKLQGSDCTHRVGTKTLLPARSSTSTNSTAAKLSLQIVCVFRTPCMRRLTYVSFDKRC